MSHTPPTRDDDPLRAIRISADLYTWPPPFAPLHDQRDSSGVGGTYLPPMPHAWPDPEPSLGMSHQLIPPPVGWPLPRTAVRSPIGLEPLAPPPDTRRAPLPPRLPPPPTPQLGSVALSKHHELSLTKRCQGPRLLSELYGSALKDEQPTERCQQVR